ncbi:MAG: hypothetical protein ACYDEY_10845 [Acidimicrobiales bacterium]
MRSMVLHFANRHSQLVAQGGRRHFESAGSEMKSRGAALIALRTPAVLALLVLTVCCSRTSSIATRSTKAPLSHAPFRPHLVNSGTALPASEPATATGSCSAAEFAYSLHTNTASGFGSTPGAVIGVTMTPSAPCTVGGFPSVSFTSTNGPLLSFSDIHEVYPVVSSTSASMLHATPRAPVGFWVSYLDEARPGTNCEQASKMTVSFASGTSATAQFSLPVRICGSSVAVSSLFEAIYPPPPPGPPSA